MDIIKKFICIFYHFIVNNFFAKKTHFFILCTKKNAKRKNENDRTMTRVLQIYARDVEWKTLVQIVYAAKHVQEKTPSDDDCII